MARYYSDDEMSRLYAPGDTMRFSRGFIVMTAEAADRLTWGLVALDRASGKYRRESNDPGIETALINEARLRDQLREKTPSAWSSSRP